MAGVGQPPQQQVDVMIVETLKLRRAHQMLDKLRHGQKVTDEELRDLLGKSSWSRLQTEIDAVREYRRTSQAVPAYLVRASKRYRDQLAIADRLEALAERSRRAAPPPKAMYWKMVIQRLRFGVTRRENYRIRAERAYEVAIETLQEILDEFPELVHHLDRHPIFDGDYFNVTPDPASVPRIQNARSVHKQKASSIPKSIRQLKICAVRESIST